VIFHRSEATRVIGAHRIFFREIAGKFSKNPIREMRMMRNQLAANSAHQAQAILGAWSSGNIDLFCQELNRVGQCAPTEIGCEELNCGESEEVERMELLRAIAADLRIPSVKPLADDPGNVYGNLLRHLASSRIAGRCLQTAQVTVLQ
jgi:hypothetical protein